MKVMVSGAAGFVGRALVPALTDAGHQVIATSRNPQTKIPGATVCIVGDLGPDTDWTAALQGVDAVIHLAARVHVMQDTAADPLYENRRINTEGTIRLAEQAAAAGAKRFVFLSTIKVNGEQTTDTPFRGTDAPNPQDPYAIAKAEAETALAALSKRTGMEVVMVRPPLVYGPDVRGNFGALVNICARGWPLPLASADNRRSLIYVGNLAAALCLCLQSPAAAGKTWLVRDGEDLSTATLIRRISAALDEAGLPGRRPRLWPIPTAVLRLLGHLTGKSAAVSRLLDDLRVDDTEIRRDLDWTPPFSVVQGLKETAARFVAVQKER